MIYFIFEGKGKESAQEKEYVKRIASFYPCEIREVKKIEEAKIPNGNVILLDEKGNASDSISFAVEFLGPKVSMGESIVFLVAGAFGPSDEFKEKYPSMRLSDFTMPHDLARIVLLEQVYRAMTIIYGKKYHY